MLDILFVMIFGLSGRVLAKDPKGKFSSPVLDVTEKQLIIETNQTLQLNCRGRWELQWVLPSSVPKVYHGTQIEESPCGKKNKQYCSRLTLSPALAQHTGSYRCRYRQKQRKPASVYVYITDSQRPFVKVQSEIPDVVYMKEGEPLVFPCRVTHPDAKVSLVKFPLHRLVPDHRSITWNSKHGFTVRSPTFFYIGLFSCETIVNGVKYTNKFLTHRPVNKIMDVYLNSTGLVHTLQGEMLALNCTVTAEWNSRVSISWTYPGKANGSGTVIRRIASSRTNMLFYSILTIPRLSKSDRGLYKCHVTSGPSKRDTNTTVIVYDKPFIRLKHRDGPVVQASAGQKSFRLSPKLRAFPAPEIIWLKDAMVASEQCSRYHVDGYSLVIRDVAEEDAGLYTILTGIQQYGLYQNLTTTVVVNVKPQIGEKSVSSPQPATVQRGVRRALHCTSHGVPPPQIQWLWHPCPPKGLCEKPPPSSWIAVGEKTEVTSTHNPILTISNRQEVLQGKNKTVGVLTVGEALISGIYRCVASNFLDRDELDICFYVTDVRGGFVASLEEEPREGGDLRLVCIANKHLYSDLSWYRITNQSTASEEHSVLRGELTEGQFSLTLRLLLKNVTTQDSGSYRCSTTDLLTGERMNLDTPVEVTVLQAPVLLQNLSHHNVNVSSSVTLHCPAQGVPQPRIIWYKDQSKLQQVSGIMLFPEEGTLHIDRITAEDQGLYTCEATNERGSVESSAYIWVQSSSDSLSLEIPTLACTCVVATLFWLLLTLLIRKLKQSDSTNGTTEYLPIILHPGEEPLTEHCDRLQYDPNQWEFPRERLKLEKPLGRGAFGQVMQASAFGIGNLASCTTVAVKMLKDGATPSEHKALMTELKILNHIGHHLNVVNLLGACTKPGGPLMVIVEYCKFGNLSAYLKSKREVFLLNRVITEEEEDRTEEGCHPRLVSVSSSRSNASSGLNEEREEHSEDDSESLPESTSPLMLEDLISYSFQVARGMEFLATRKCIHRDLAARNILLSNNNVVKICDFGLARDVYKDPDYVRKGDARLPLKWMAPESIFDKVFTTQSDVWSYGVLLWEIFSLGASPYPGVNIDEEFCHRLKQGTRMCPPEYSTPEIYSIMCACWENTPEDRPSFTTLVEILGDLLQTCVRQDGKDYIPLNTFISGECNMENLNHKDRNQTTSGTLIYMNAGKIKAMSTFEEDIHREISDDNQSDSGMILPSEELIQVKWMDRFKTKNITRFFSKGQNHCTMLPIKMLPCMKSAPCRHEDNIPHVAPHVCFSERCCSAPPDYNAAALYPCF
ncbi:vascular endothelial growth factor receptor 1 isoform X2 [Triplophysa rosa]|uniref:vascular endothelial growth factor receptor 1 isoform X2 n=1 Tax=Triplophysa rosa TaxID=992332 RepID=UPI002545F7A9|nr:vascular endothelial growth factor receptor 1 isoform X2 [Triplophysa rosa]